MYIYDSILVHLFMKISRFYFLYIREIIYNLRYLNIISDLKIVHIIIKFNLHQCVYLCIAYICVYLVKNASVKVSLVYIYLNNIKIIIKYNKNLL